MKCRSCGYVSFDQLSVCTNCGAPANSAAAAPASAPPSPGEGGGPRPWLDAGGGAVFTAEPPAAPARVRGDVKRRRGGRRSVPQPGEAPEPPASLFPAACPDEPPVVGEGDLDVRPLPAVPASPPEPPGASLEEADLELAWPLPKAGEPGTPAEAPPVIDRVEEIPDRFWAPEGAGLVRRAVALLVDQALLAALLGLFLAGAALALRWVGTDASALFSGSGLQAALTPLALLTALLSLAYHVSFHAVAGRTPGKRLAGLEVRCGDGAALTWGKAALRWCGGALGLACGGIGIAWALFEPRRRGWADLVSDTLIVERVPEDRSGAG